METDTANTNVEDTLSATDDNVPVESNTTDVDTSAVNTQQSGAQPNPAPQKQNGSVSNHSAAVRRIQSTNRQLRSEVNRLTREIQRLQSSAKPEDHAVADKLLDKAETYQTIVSNGEREAWEQNVAETYGNQAQQYIELFDKYAQHVNTNEPQLVEYLATPYGMLLLGEWAKRMEVPQYRMEWQQMPQHRKSMVLARFYDEIEKIANGGTPSVAAKQNTNVVPAVAGGTKSSATRNDLGSYIEDAFKAFGAK